MSSDHVEGWVDHVMERAEFLRQNLSAPEIAQHKGQPWSLISAVEGFTQREKIPMLISRAKMEVIGDLLSQMEPKPKIIVELGTYVGNSAVGFAAILKDLHGSDAQGLHVYTMEMDPKTAQVARELIKLSGLDNIVTVLEGPASESIKKLHAEGKIKTGELDMIFIDHWEKYYVPDLQVCEELGLFHKGSLACADNTDYPGAPTYLKYVKGGGSGKPNSVRYESKSHRVENEARKSVVEVSTVVES